MKKFIIFTITIATVVFSCKKKCDDPKALNFDERGECTFKTYDIPTTYVFKDSEGNSTVDFSGQQQRLDMLSEMVSYMKTANTKGTTVDASKLKSMFSNTSYTWLDANALGMTGSSKQLKDKCAGGDATITALFESWMDSIANISTLNRDGSTGIAGVYPNDGTKGPYLMDANGIEYAQWVEKGLMGAVFYYQMTNVYFSDTKMNVENSMCVNNQKYTLMEHHWDEAFGYFTSSADYPNTGTDRFWGKYAASYETLLGSQTKLMNAFLKGRAAISNDDLDVRNEQITIIRNEMEKLIAASAIHYLNDAVTNITKNTTRNHSLSEATAFIDALKYGYNSVEGISISKTEIDSILNTIGNDFNNVTATNLKSARDVLSTKFGLDSIKEQL